VSLLRLSAIALTCAFVLLRSTHRPPGLTSEARYNRTNQTQISRGEGVGYKQGTLRGSIAGKLVLPLERRGANERRTHSPELEWDSGSWCGQGRSLKS
jgi:hypothetical protein